MPDSNPAVRPNSTAAPAPIQANSQGTAPAPLGGISPVPVQQPTSLAPTSDPTAPAPASVLSSSVAPAPVARSEVAIAPAPTSIAAPPVAPVAFVADAIAALAPRQTTASEHVVPPPYHNLLYFEDLSEVVSAIGKVKGRVGTQERRFAWSRVDSEPKIEISTFSELTTAVFGADRSDFKADELLNAAINKLPPEVAQWARDKKSSKSLEGLWIEFPGTGIPGIKPRLSIAVSIPAFPTNVETVPVNVEPFPAKSVYLTFGDFQP